MATNKNNKKHKCQGCGAIRSTYGTYCITCTTAHLSVIKSEFVTRLPDNGYRVNIPNVLVANFRYPAEAASAIKAFDPKAGA